MGGHHGDGYWLYALSNAGSLLALLAYPLLIEPRLSLTAQRSIWSVGYVAFLLLMGIIRLLKWALIPVSPYMLAMD